MSKKVITNSDLIFGDSSENGKSILEDVWIPENAFSNKSYITYMMFNDIIISYVNDIIKFVRENHPECNP